MGQALLAQLIDLLIRRRNTELADADAQKQTGFNAAPKAAYYVCPIEEVLGSADKNIRMSSIPNSPNVCPIDSDETAEAYIMERLSPADALHFENHCMTCRPCAAAAKEAEWFVRELRVAAQKLVVEPRDRPRLWSQAWLIGGLCRRSRCCGGGELSSRYRRDGTIPEEL